MSNGVHRLNRPQAHIIDRAQYLLAIGIGKRRAGHEAGLRDQFPRTENREQTGVRQLVSEADVDPATSNRISWREIGQLSKPYGIPLADKVGTPVGDA